jgi:hypothetical protein
VVHGWCTRGGQVSEARLESTFLADDAACLTLVRAVIQLRCFGIVSLGCGLLSCVVCGVSSMEYGFRQSFIPLVSSPSPSHAQDTSAVCDSYNLGTLQSSHRRSRRRDSRLARAYAYQYMRATVHLHGSYVACPRALARALSARARCVPWPGQRPTELKWGLHLQRHSSAGTQA